uniref:Uncharacterized protein n=1 Tax=Panagrolaimus superbus TaxID=310955 RepID=A0A914Y0N0_9BILA
MDNGKLGDQIHQNHEELKLHVDHLFKKFKLIQARVEELLTNPAFVADAGIHQQAPCESNIATCTFRKPDGSNVEETVAGNSSFKHNEAKSSAI